MVFIVAIGGTWWLSFQAKRLSGSGVSVRRRASLDDAIEFWSERHPDTEPKIFDHDWIWQEYSRPLDDGSFSTADSVRRVA